MMRSFLATIFRSTVFPLVSVSLTYYPGMAVARIARRFREFYYQPGAQPDLRLVKLPWGQKMSVDRNSYMGGSMYWTGVHHLQELVYLNSRLSPGMCFIDVGANQGEFSVFAAHKVGHGSVIAFEPVTKTRNLLLKNIELNRLKNITVYDFGLSDQRGQLPVYTSNETQIHHGVHEGLSSLYPTETRSVLEETITLEVFDDFFQNQKIKPDVIKIDVEGAEWFVLKGMQKLLSVIKPELLIEINEETFQSAGYTTMDLIQYLESFGYKPYTIRKGAARPWEQATLPNWGNFIFRA